jgi:hypothetical protein
MLEEDEKFYAMFPEARKAAIEQHPEWMYRDAPLGQYFAAPGFQYYSEPIIYGKATSHYHDRRLSDPRMVCAYSTAAPLLRDRRPDVLMDGSGLAARQSSLTQHRSAERRSSWDIQNLPVCFFVCFNQII